MCIESRVYEDGFFIFWSRMSKHLQDGSVIFEDMKIRSRVNVEIW